MGYIHCEKLDFTGERYIEYISGTVSGNFTVDNVVKMGLATHLHYHHSQNNSSLSAPVERDYVHGRSNAPDRHFIFFKVAPEVEIIIMYVKTCFYKKRTQCFHYR